MSIEISKMVGALKESSTLAMAAKAREYKQKGINVISLSLGEPDFPTPKHICDGAKKAIDSNKYFAYPPVGGYLDLREAISQKLKKENHIDYDANQIVVSNGAKQSLANLFASIINPDDEVIVFAPYWVTYPAQIKIFGGIPVPISGTLENDFKATAQQLEAAITPKTKAIIYSSPSNPTGGVFSKEELEAIVKVVQKHPNILIIADEIYEHIVYDVAHISIASIGDIAKQTVIVNGFAKGFAMTGWRVGYIAAPIEIAKACAKIQGQFTSANCSIAQRAALTAITTDLAPTFQMRDAYRNRRDFVYTALKKIFGEGINLPEGAFYFFPEVKQFFGKKTPNGEEIKNANDFSMYLLDFASVSTVSGGGFGAPNYIRISYAASDDDLKQAMISIENAINKLV